MNDATKLPLALYKTHLQLQAGLAKLVRDNAKQWLSFNERLAEEATADGDTMIADLLQSDDWQALAALPAEALWRHVEQRFGDGQALLQTAFNAQTDFTRGLQEVLQTWQKGTAKALGGGIQSTPFDGSAWTDLLKPWQSLLPAGTVAAQKAQAAPRKDKQT